MHSKVKYNLRRRLTCTSAIKSYLLSENRDVNFGDRKFGKFRCKLYKETLLHTTTPVLYVLSSLWVSVWVRVGEFELSNIEDWSKCQHFAVGVGSNAERWTKDTVKPSFVKWQFFVWSSFPNKTQNCRRMGVGCGGCNGSKWCRWRWMILVWVISTAVSVGEGNPLRRLPHNSSTAIHTFWCNFHPHKHSLSFPSP